MSARLRPAMRCLTRSEPRISSCTPTTAMDTMQAGKRTVLLWTGSWRTTCCLRGNPLMDLFPADFDQYWQQTLDLLASYPACPEIDILPLRTTDFATLYGVRLTSLGPYRVFGYLSVPTGVGPFPALYYAPRYQSVLEIIPQGTA